MIVLDFPVSQFDNTTDCVIQVMRVILKTSSVTLHILKVDCLVRFGQ